MVVIALACTTIAGLSGLSAYVVYKVRLLEQTQQHMLENNKAHVAYVQQEFSKLEVNEVMWLKDYHTQFLREMSNSRRRLSPIMHPPKGEAAATANDETKTNEKFEDGAQILIAQ